MSDYTDWKETIRFAVESKCGGRCTVDHMAAAPEFRIQWQLPVYVFWRVSYEALEKGRLIEVNAICAKFNEILKQWREDHEPPTRPAEATPGTLHGSASEGARRAADAPSLASGIVEKSGDVGTFQPLLPGHSD